MVKNNTQTIIRKPVFTDISYPLRETTIPSSIVHQFELDQGDLITWKILNIKDKTIQLTFTKKE
jgi:hypothetical protein